ncbi:hypothetical protein MANES_13G093432v8 [Manihot esculenta]|uniref:Uncharacterized protein n=1 Tax=Manihot esculenta TaxID=3983 RepID=A0ACB7GLZ6_MANES|nr:hypothetical protein MANES_13G093432v8 [Manihot esculenta]
MASPKLSFSFSKISRSRDLYGFYFLSLPHQYNVLQSPEFSFYKQLLSLLFPSTFTLTTIIAFAIEKVAIFVVQRKVMVIFLSMVQLLALSRRRRRNWDRPKVGIERRKGEGTKLKWVKEKQLEQEKHLGLRGERRRRVYECEVRGERRGRVDQCEARRKKEEVRMRNSKEVRRQQLMP